MRDIQENGTTTSSREQLRIARLLEFAKSLGLNPEAIGLQQSLGGDWYAGFRTLLILRGVKIGLSAAKGGTDVGTIVDEVDEILEKGEGS